MMYGHAGIRSTSSFVLLIFSSVALITAVAKWAWLSDEVQLCGSSTYLHGQPRSIAHSPTTPFLSAVVTTLEQTVSGFSTRTVAEDHDPTPTSPTAATPDDIVATCESVGLRPWSSPRRSMLRRGFVKLRPRKKPLEKIVDITQYGFPFAATLLKVRILETLEFVDEMHVAEGNRDFSGKFKEYTFEETLGELKKELPPKWARLIEQKVKYHKFEIPDHVRNYEMQTATVDRALRRIGACYDAEVEGWERGGKRGKKSIVDPRNAKGHPSCLVVEGDLDEIPARPILKAIRYCLPADGSMLHASAQSINSMYNMEWAWNPHDKGSEKERNWSYAWRGSTVG